MARFIMSQKAPSGEGIQAAKSVYRQTIRKRILTDRISCLNERYEDKFFNKEAFERL